MALIPFLTGKVLAITPLEPNNPQTNNGYYQFQIQILVHSHDFYNAWKKKPPPIGQTINLYLHTQAKNLPIKPGDLVSTIAFQIPQGWEAEGFRKLPENHEQEASP